MLRAKHFNSGYPRHQFGVALLVFMMFLLLASAGVLLEKVLGRAQNNALREQQSSTALVEAKASLISWAVSNSDEPGTLPWPDRNADGNYDGASDCVTVGFNNSHLLGRLPFAGEITCGSFVAFGSFSRDGAGEPLWYAVSRNLLWNRGQTNPDPPINPGLLDATPTYPWITVCNKAGNLISNRVAAVIIAPGAALSGQDRSGATPAANQYLDSVTLGGITYNNFDSDGLPDAAPCGAPGEDFIIYPDSRFTPDVNDSFNDRLIYITIDELMPKVERRVLGDAAVGLEQYRVAYGRYPWLSPYQDPTASASAATGAITLGGRIEAVNGGDRLIDNEANFPPSGPNELNDYLVVNVTRGTVWEINDQHDPDDLHINDNPDFQPGDAYNILPTLSCSTISPAPINCSAISPEFKGNVRIREGHIPFIKAGESYAIATGWTLTWSNGITPAPDCATPLFPSQLTLDTDGCTSLQISYQAGTWVRAQPTTQFPALNDGNCVWTDSNTVDCMSNTETRPNAYSVDLTCTGPPVCGVATLFPDTPVTRTYTYTMNFTGNGQISPTVFGNLKTRQVINTALTTIQMQDIVNINGTDYDLWNDTVSIPVNNYIVNGIYFDIEDNVEFPGYFFTNLWHQYIYVKISDEHVAINDAGAASSDNCTNGDDCISLQIGATVVRNDIQAVIVGAGGQLAGQDRSSGNVADYFEGNNAVSANDTAERGTLAAAFNDQTRVVTPNPP